MIIRIFIIPFVVKSKQELGTEELPRLSCKDPSVAPLPQCGGDQLGKLVAQPDFWYSVKNCPTILLLLLVCCEATSFNVCTG